jgi:hypothetical protein
MDPLLLAELHREAGQGLCVLAVVGADDVVRGLVATGGVTVRDRVPELTHVQIQSGSGVHLDELFSARAIRLLLWLLRGLFILCGRRLLVPDLVTDRVMLRKRGCRSGWVLPGRFRDRWRSDGTNVGVDRCRVLRIEEGNSEVGHSPRVMTATTL